MGISQQQTILEPGDTCTAPEGFLQHSFEKPECSVTEACYSSGSTNCKGLKIIKLWLGDTVNVKLEHLQSLGNPERV